MLEASWEEAFKQPLQKANFSFRMRLKPKELSLNGLLCRPATSVGIVPFLHRSLLHCFNHLGLARTLPTGTAIQQFRSVVSFRILPISTAIQQLTRTLLLHLIVFFFVH